MRVSKLADLRKSGLLLPSVWLLLLLFCIKFSILLDRFIRPALAEGVKREENVEELQEKVLLLFLVLYPGVCPTGEFKLEVWSVLDPWRVLFRNDEVVRRKWGGK